MNEEFPYNNWYLEFTEEERPVVDNWRINIIKYSDNPCPSNFINCAGHARLRGSFVRGRGKISFNQFKQYVLNEPIQPTLPEDHSVLIKLLTQI